MEIISKISKGSKMDQIYIPRNRYGMQIGSYVVIRPFIEQKIKKKPYLYNISSIEPIKMKIIEELFDFVDRKINKYDNIIITGSFLDKGFTFNDIDIIVISDENVNTANMKKEVEKLLGIKADILSLDNRSLIAGLSTDPLYQTMLSKCVAKRRFIYKIQKKINYKLLDLHLLKSEIVIDNFDTLTGREKYYYTRNMIAIYLFLHFKKITRELIDNEIKRMFNIDDISLIKENLVNKKRFLYKYKNIYGCIFKRIMKRIRENASNGSK
ncbi:hypothetical protein HZA96_03190 [Candidatus Woesearchaeota archaeon]|nr:hypothetical protein [Candidatus Woesearchaeota archaeon]